jgi:NitT/TauT family transport system ATP-binding protein
MSSQFGQPILVVNNLSTIFKNGGGGLSVLEDISFRVQNRQFVCVLGPSGCGKSVLLRVLSGLLTPSEGVIELDGKMLNAPRRGVGMVFQNANLMPWRNVLQNITLPLELKGIPLEHARASAQDLVDLVGLQGFEKSLPRDLSGGMAQRVAIARALVHDPKLLLLDEPFGSLDALTRERMGKELLRIWRYRLKTVIMVTHSIDEAIYLADRVLVLSDRPARIKLDLMIDLTRPRKEEIRYTPEFGALAQQMWEAIG